MDIYDFTKCYFGRSFTRPPLDTDVTVFATNSTVTFYQIIAWCLAYKTSHYMRARFTEAVLLRGLVHLTHSDVRLFSSLSDVKW